MNQSIPPSKLELKASLNGDEDIQSITRGPRQSNIELLRIVAMFLVLVVHADFLSLGRPTAADFADTPLAALCRMFFESCSIVCVNLFVLISGWFSIKPTLKGVCNFLFQCVFIALLIYVVGFFFGIYDWNFIEVLLNGLLLNYDGYWFIKSYLLLYVLAPILNAFIQQTSKQLAIKVLVCFFVLQTLWSSVSLLKTGYFQNGYSPLSFIGLYLLAQTIKKFYHDYALRTALWLYFGALLVLFISSSAMFAIGRGNTLIEFWAYSNPLVILESIGLFMVFVRIKIQPNKIINWISASAFAVYLFHIHPIVIDRYKVVVQSIYEQYNSIMVLFILLVFLICVFSVGILIDQPRKFFWRWICRIAKF